MRRAPRYVHAYVDRHGKPRFYFRRPGFKKIALPGLPWSPEFMQAYEAALNHALPIVIGARRTRPGTVDDAVARYLGSVVFAALAPATQKNRRSLLERFRVAHGDKRIGALRSEHVARLIGKLRPHAQRNLLKTLRALAAFARGLLGVHSRYGLHTRAVTVYRDTLTGGFSHFVTSMTAPVASGWSGCRVGLAPTGKRRLVTAHTRSGPCWDIHFTKRTALTRRKMTVHDVDAVVASG